MKILHYINNLGSGGAEKLLTDILPLLQSQENIVHVVVSNNSATVEKFRKIIINSKIEILDLKKSFYNPLQVIRLITILKRENYDIVHAHLFPSQYWLALASLFKPYKTILVKTEHSVFNERKNYIILRPLEKFIYKRYSIIICITEDVKKNLKEWLGYDDNLLVIENGVNLKEFKFHDEKFNFVNCLYDTNYINILMVGRFDGIAKDQKTLINALKVLPSNYRLFFAGEGPDLVNVKNYSTINGLEDRVIYLGRRDDIANLMCTADINVLSTNFEGMSGVTLEALASGKPFLGSDVVGVKTIVPNSNFLFEKSNFKMLSDKIQLIINDDQLRSDMKKQSSEFIKNYDIQIMVTKYLNLYKNISI